MQVYQKVSLVRIVQDIKIISLSLYSLHPLWCV